MRLTVFWERMRQQFGEPYAESVAKDYVLSNLGGRTVNKALTEGEDVKTVWRAVCEAFSVPESLRLFRSPTFQGGICRGQRWIAAAGPPSVGPP